MKIKNKIIYFNNFGVVLTLFFEFGNSQTRGPRFFVEIHEHLHFKFIFSVVDRHRIIVAVKAMHQSLDGRLLEMTDVRSGLSRLLSKHQNFRFDVSKCINNDFTFDTVEKKKFFKFFFFFFEKDFFEIFFFLPLDWIDDHRNRSWMQLFPILLCITIDIR